MKYLFGPVFSRRLGVSLGVNLFKDNICSYDCIYCECGRTNDLTIERDDFIPLKDLIEEIDDYLSVHCLELDHITFSGSGEPTLFKDIKKVLSEIKKYPVATALLTNSSMLSNDEVRKDILLFDVIMPTISTVDEQEFLQIHRPHKKIRLSDILEGVRRFSKQYKGNFIPEIMIIKNINDNRESLNRLAKFLKTVDYNWCYLNTIVRPAAYKEYSGVTEESISEIRKYLQENGIRCEISKRKIKKSPVRYSDDSLLNTLKIRPIKKDDIKRIFSDPEYAISGVERLIKENKVRLEGDFLSLI